MAFQPMMRYVLREFKIDFIAQRDYATIFSTVLVLASLVSFAVQGLNFGIDFAGGILVEVRSQKEEAVDLSELRGRLNNLDLGDVSINTFGEGGRDLSIRAQQQEGGEAAQTAALNRIQAALGEGWTLLRTEVVGPKVGEELVINGALAIALALIGIMVYVWLRFEWQFALGALLSITHDVITTVGIFSIFQIQFDLNTVAAVLTITGVSINDTVVVYDRVREMLRKYKKLPLADLLNFSLNKVFARTLVTNVTVALGVLALLVGGGDVLWGLSLALMWGMFIGSYSTVYAALPMLVYFEFRRDEFTGPAEPEPAKQPAA